MFEVVCSAAHAQVKGLREMHVYPGSAQKWQPAVTDSKHIIGAGSWIFCVPLFTLLLYGSCKDKLALHFVLGAAEAA